MKDWVNTLIFGVWGITMDYNQRCEVEELLKILKPIQDIIMWQQCITAILLVILLMIRMMLVVLVFRSTGAL